MVSTSDTTTSIISCTAIEILSIRFVSSPALYSLKNSAGRDTTLAITAMAMLIGTLGYVIGNYAGTIVGIVLGV